MSKIRVAINGMGRIGRITLRNLLEKAEVEVVACNGTMTMDTLAHLMKYDSVHRIYPGEVRTEGDVLIVDGVRIQHYGYRDPAEIPWKKHEVDIVIESTGVFRKRDGMQKHLAAGAKKVLLTAPAASADDVDATIVMGVNEHVITPDLKLVSNASCTTNCLAPVAKVIHEKFGIKRGLMTTVHAYTNDQAILDARHKDLRRARAAAMSIIPTSTGAAKAVGLVLPELKGKMDGFAMRVPTPDGSVVDLSAELSRDVTAEEINAAVKEASQGAMKGLIEYTEDPIVSIDIVGNPHSAIFDSKLTKVMGGNFAKIVAWYDNEYGYSCRVADLACRLFK